MSDPAAAFATTPGITYMDAATYGLPPREAITAMHAALDAWAGGRTDWVADWDRPAETTRAEFAALASVPEANVALIPAVSVGASWVAATLGPGDEVVAPDDEFTSLLFPILVAAERGVRVREVPFDDLADAIDAQTTVVATSLVQMQTGRRADLWSIQSAAEGVGARVLLDATQALPFMRPGEDLGSVDYVLVHAYKHLLCPRGVAFMVVREDRWTDLPAAAANWRAAIDPYGRYFGGPLSLGPGARRFDVSLAWHAWVGAAESLRCLREWQMSGALEGVWGLARTLASSAGLDAVPSTLVCVPVADPEGARRALASAGIRASVRGSAVRLSVHLWNSEGDCHRALEVLEPFVAS
jgi:selenocysteine lyase/cysteine desulfurase